MPQFSNKCVIYARVSTVDKQEYKRQIDELRKFADNKGFVIAEVFAEKISGVIKASERPVFNKMVKFIDEFDIHHILVSELSRLGRKMRDTLNILSDLIEKQINVHVLSNGLSTLDKNFKEDKITSLLISILTNFADIERDYIINRSKSGTRYKVKNGGAGAGIIKPYGYKKDGKKLIIDEEEAETVKYIFNKYLDGFGSGQIADLLNEQGIQTKYNRIFNPDKTIRTRKGAIKTVNKFVWRNTTIINILSNTIYYGDRRYKDEIFEIEPIIDKETFLQTEKIRKEKFNKKNNNTKYENILQGTIKCPVCGSGYFMHKRANKKDYAYKCLSKKLKEINCNNNSINIDKLNNAVYYFLKDSFKYKAVFEKKITSKTDKIKDAIELINAEINQLNSEFNSLELKLKNIMRDMYADPHIRKINTELKSETLQDIKKLETRILLKNEELQNNKNVLKTITSTKIDSFEDVNVFKKYVKDYITFIKIYNVTHLVDLAEFGKYFSVKNDIISLVEVECDLIENYHTFLISRFSEFIIELDLKDTEDLGMKIPYLFNYQVSTVGNEIKV